MKSARYAAFAAASLMSFFAQATTFASLGVVAYDMALKFHWSDQAIGNAYVALGLSCCFTSILPVFTIPRIGVRFTIAGGGLILTAGFILAALTTSLTTLLIASTFFGLAFALVANTACTYLVAGWFGAQAPRMLGAYLMLSALGTAAGPPAAQYLVSSPLGALGYWHLMAAIGIALSLICALCIGEPPHDEASRHALKDEWSFGKTLFTPQFILLAACMALTQVCITTVQGVTAPQIVQLGGTADFAAIILGLQALAGTAATLIAGWAAEKSNPRNLLCIGLLGQTLGMILLGYGHVGWQSYLFALIFGIGWAAACLAITVLLIAYFGNKRGSAALSMIWMLSGIAAFGPAMATSMAGPGGSFAHPLAIMGLILLPLAAASLFMRPPHTITGASFSKTA